MLLSEYMPSMPEAQPGGSDLWDYVIGFAFGIFLVVCYVHSASEIIDVYPLQDTCSREHCTPILIDASNTCLVRDAEKDRCAGEDSTFGHPCCRLPDKAITAHLCVHTNPPRMDVMVAYGDPIKYAKAFVPCQDGQTALEVRQELLTKEGLDRLYQYTDKTVLFMEYKSPGGIAFLMGWAFFVVYVFVTAIGLRG